MERSNQATLVNPDSVQDLKHPVVTRFPADGMRSHVYVIADIKDPNNDEVVEGAPLIKTLSLSGERAEDGKFVTLIGGYVMGRLIETLEVEMGGLHESSELSRSRRKLVKYGKKVLEEQGIKVPQQRTQKKQLV